MTADQEKKEEEKATILSDKEEIDNQLAQMVTLRDSAKQLLNEIQNKIEELKKLPKKDLQLKAIDEMKGYVPFLSAFPPKKIDVKIAILGLEAVAKAKFDKLEKYADQIETFNNLLQPMEKKFSIFDKRSD